MFKLSEKELEELKEIAMKNARRHKEYMENREEDRKRNPWKYELMEEILKEADERHRNSPIICRPTRKLMKRS